MKSNDAQLYKISILVITAIVAMLFCSCEDSSDDDDPPQRGEEICIDLDEDGVISDDECFYTFFDDEDDEDDKVDMGGFDYTYTPDYNQSQPSTGDPGV
ncbi:MAG: hypothetical protein EOM20_04140 [Spartobacteria bacterium]|nr:hypothetical protein [Spartobacteria bacterium]